MILGALLLASCASAARTVRLPAILDSDFAPNSSLVGVARLESDTAHDSSFEIQVSDEIHEPSQSAQEFSLFNWFVLSTPAGGATGNRSFQNKTRHSQRITDLEAGQIQALVYHPRHYSHFIRHFYGPEYGPRHCDTCKGFIDYETALRQSSGSILLFWFLLLIPLLTWLLGTTAQEYFVPSLLYWTERLGMQPEIASATIIALGMSAPDVFSAVLAAEADDLPLALSEILGANMFHFCISASMVIVAAAYLIVPQQSQSPEEASLAALAAERAGKEQRQCLWVPLGMLLATTCALAFLFFQGHFTKAKAMLLFLLYAVYIGFLVFRGRTGGGESVGEERSQRSEGTAGDSVERLPGADLATAAAGPVPPLEGLDMPKDTFSLTFMFWLYPLPYYIVRWASIPPSDGLWDRQRRLVSTCAPVGFLIFLVVVVPGLGDTLGRVGFTALLSLSVFVSYGVYTTSTDGPKLPWFYPALALTAAISSVIWLGAIAAELTALIEAVGFVLHVRRLRLGFTAIAWGNAAGDILTCYALARRGQLRTAFNAVFSNPLVADWIGLGTVLLLAVHRAEAGGDATKLWVERCPPEMRVPLAVCFCGLLGAAVLHGARLLCGGGLAPKSAWTWAGILVAWYVAFICMILYVSDN